MSWLSTERNWCWSKKWVSQSLWSLTSQPRFPSTTYFYFISESARHSALIPCWTGKHPLRQAGSRQKARSYTKDASSRQVSCQISQILPPWPVMERFCKDVKRFYKYQIHYKLILDASNRDEPKLLHSRLLLPRNIKTVHWLVQRPLVSEIKWNILTTYYIQLPVRFNSFNPNMSHLKKIFLIITAFRAPQMESASMT